VPVSAERSTYVLFSSVALLAVFAGWQPLGGVVWAVQQPIGVALLYGLYFGGWLLVLYSTFLISHSDLLGLRQVWLQFRCQPYTPLSFCTPGLYRQVRHPLYVGWLLAFWATPTMSLTHLLFALMTTLYILVGIWLEERDLVEALPEYRAYQQRVPMLIPRLSRRAQADRTTAADRAELA
jgi:protein-S-isoprenylcysteine O-methyltransferase Ste14